MAPVQVPNRKAVQQFERSLVQAFNLGQAASVDVSIAESITLSETPHPDGTLIVHNGNKVQFVDLSTLDIFEVSFSGLSNTSEDSGIAIHKALQRVFIPAKSFGSPDYDSDVYYKTYQDTDLTQVTSVSEDFSNVAVDDENDKLFYTLSSGNTGIYIADLDGNNSSRIRVSASIGYPMRWNPNDSKLYFYETTISPDLFYLKSIDNDGGNEVTIYSAQPNAGRVYGGSIHFDYKGEKVYFFAGELDSGTSYARVYRCDYDGSNLELLNSTTSTPNYRFFAVNDRAGYVYTFEGTGPALRDVLVRFDLDFNNKTTIISDMGFSGDDSIIDYGY